MGQLTQGPNVPIPRTNHKRSNGIFSVKSIALICGRMRPQLLQPLAQSLIRSPGTLVPGIVPGLPGTPLLENARIIPTIVNHGGLR